MGPEEAEASDLLLATEPPDAYVADMAGPDLVERSSSGSEYDGIPKYEFRHLYVDEYVTKRGRTKV